MNRIYFLTYILACTFTLVCGQSQEDTYVIEGQVLRSFDHSPLVRASINIIGTANSARTNELGEFRLATDKMAVNLLVTHVGYQSKTIEIKFPFTPILIELSEADETIEEIVVSTGYQDLPITATTGSYTVVDSSLYHRSTGADILGRLNHVTSGLVFNKDTYAGENNISIRGMNTIFGDAQPLIVLDNFPYTGDINLINPNDVESVTILKDAAAASIWGAKAGNGVIVINTKNGKKGDQPSISFNSSVRLKEKPNLFFARRMNGVDYIETERRLFDEGFYQVDEDSYDNKPLSPAVELMIARRDGLMSQNEFEQAIDKLKTQDLVKDVSTNLYRPASAQQYAINFSGGNDIHRYYLSGGFDRSLEERMGNESKRYSLNLNQDFDFFHNKLKLSNRIGFADNLVTENAPEFIYERFAPYLKLVDNGNHPPIANDYRQGFINNAMEQGLLDWTYNPVTEIKNRDYSTAGRYFRFNPGLELSISQDLKLQANYQFSFTTSESRKLDKSSGYKARDLINRYSALDPAGNIIRPIPEGGIMNLYSLKNIGKSWRGQVQYNSSWSDTFIIQAIAGVEERTEKSSTVSDRIYGFEEEFGHGHQVDGTTYYTMYHNPYMNLRIPTPYTMGELHDNYRSFYSNINLTYADKYTLSGSARVDQSNLFGVKTNQKGVPLYSFGASWRVSDESFYRFRPIPVLRLRATFGYNGNVNKNASALPTARYYEAGLSVSNLPYAQMQNPPNPMLRWERVRIWNLGLDFKLVDKILTGSVEVYNKTGMDLIGTIPYRPSSGITNFTGNFANTEGTGFEMTLNSTLLRGNLTWNTDFLLSHVQDKVTRYDEEPSALNVINYSEGLIKTPVEGRALFALYSYQTGGLTHETGDPIGYIDGEESTDYSRILANTALEDLIYHGSTRPTWFGSLRNTFHVWSIQLIVQCQFQLRLLFQKAIGWLWSGLWSRRAIGLLFALAITR